jgi:erythromycin esterase
MVAEINADDRGRREELFRIHDALRTASYAVHSEADLDPLISRIDDAQIVLLGEASHGTSEYYTWRTRITQRLIREKGFDFIAVEGDWPDCYRVNRVLKGYDSHSVFDVLNAFERWPTWMWANREVVHLAEWLGQHNATTPEHRRIGFYGLDVYSLWESMDAVVDFLRRADPLAVQHAIDAYACFEPWARSEHGYARATALVPANCEDEVVSVLAQLRARGNRRLQAADSAGLLSAEARFDAEQNALVAVNAEHYYRTMVSADNHSWNIRATHMAETLDRILSLHQQTRDSAKAIIWAHNTHIGDARATDMAAEQIINLGQLARERHERLGVVVVGFGAFQGRVIAARAWGAPLETMRIPAAMHGSWDEVLHEGHSEDRGRLIMLDRLQHDASFQRPRGQRAIGVVYHAPYERPGNYIPTLLPQRYDALLFFENTRALHPLHGEHARIGDIPETYPSGV